MADVKIERANVKAISKEKMPVSQLWRSRDGLPFTSPTAFPQEGEPLVEMQDVCVKYGDRTVLGGWKQQIDNESREGLWWTVRRGERWGVFGPNGKCKSNPRSGKKSADAYKDLGKQHCSL